MWLIVELGFFLGTPQFVHVNQKIQQLQKRLEGLQKQPYTTIVKVVEQKNWFELETEGDEEETMWKQRSKEQWLAEVS